MGQQWTAISKHNMIPIMESDLSPREIITFLESGATYRTFADVLARVCPGKDVKKILTERLPQISGGNPESEAKNIRNWLNKAGANLPRREKLFQICFALDLDDKQASQVLASVSDTGIHYRNPKELIYAHCLKQHKSWEEAERLKEKFAPLCVFLPAASADTGAETGRNYTLQIRSAFEEQVETDEDLEEFLLENHDRFGELHETAYEMFMKMLGALSVNEKGNGQKISVRDLVEKQMQMHVPENMPKERKGKGGGASKEKRRNLTWLQRAIQKNWPSENVIYKMQNRKIDVSRKVLLLLFLLTEEFEVSDPVSLSGEETGESNYDYLEFLGEEEDAGERLEIRLMQMNLFLDSYGMNRLDPGNPFDCLVLYALRASYEEDDDMMRDRLEQMLDVLYEEN